MKPNKTLFYLLSFTWGLPMTLVGLLVGVALILVGKKPKKHGWCYYFEVGEGWGGVNLGIVFITSKNPTTRTKCHEHGHALQNCLYGVLMPFVVSIPSAVRYWYIRLRLARGLTYDKSYDAIWFEGQATQWGTALMYEMRRTNG